MALARLEAGHAFVQKKNDMIKIIIRCGAVPVMQAHVSVNLLCNLLTFVKANRPNGCTTTPSSRLCFRGKTNDTFVAPWVQSC